MLIFGNAMLPEINMESRSVTPSALRDSMTLGRAGRPGSVAHGQGENTTSGPFRSAPGASQGQRGFRPRGSVDRERGLWHHLADRFPLALLQE